MGYTSESAMEDRGFRDVDRWREKIEVRLDNRQVFFLFFGSALVACLLFVLGVIVGKRLESRGRATAPEIEDPLALLDKVASTPRTSQTAVTFPQELFAGASKPDKGAKKAAASLSVLSSEVTLPKTTGALNNRDSSPTEQPRPASEKLTKIAEKSPTSVRQVGENTLASNAIESVKNAAIPLIVSGSDSKPKGRFTLQLSSFQDKKEAEQFARKFEGERPYLVKSDIPEKGIWYRVRVGEYASDKEAKAAKLSFEKKYNVIAYIAQR
jgi:septal ring-binding cell division protein DamX